MFDALAPGKLVLTLRSTPPFVAESAFALALTILLAAPLIVRVYLLLLDKPLRALTKTTPSSRRHRHHDRASRSLLIHHYPATIEVAGSTSSSCPYTESARKINSTPALQSGRGIPASPSPRGIRVAGRTGDRGSKIRKCPPPPSRPTSFAESRYPIFDISNLDYRAYRHRLVEATLRERYDDLQPPGDVVLNSLHLNSADSAIGVRPNDRYDHSLFDSVGERCDVAGATGRWYAERLHPLDHFLSKAARRPRTSEKETGTMPDDGADRQSPDREDNRSHLSEDVDGNLAKLPGVDDNGNPCVQAPPVNARAASDRDPRSGVPILRRSIPTRSRRRADGATPGRDAENDCPRSADPSTRGEPSWTGDDRPASAGSASWGFPSSRAAILPEGRGATGSPRPGTSAAGRSRESVKKLADYPLAVPPSPGERHAGRATGGRSNFISLSSSEIASIRSDSSKRRDDGEASCRSRESSISPRSRRASSRPPWLSGNRDTSFNRKYGGNIAEATGARAARPMSARGGIGPPARQKPAAPSRGRSRESPTVPSSRGPTLPGRRAASFVASRGREPVGTSAERRREEDPARSWPRQRRDRSGDCGSAAAEDNEEGRTSKTTESPSGKTTSASGTASPPAFPGGVALSSSSSFLPSPARTQVRPRKRSPPRDAAPPADAPDASETSATMEPAGLMASRCGAEGARGRSVAGYDAGPGPGAESPLARERRGDPAKLKRGGWRRLGGAEDPAKGASLSPQIELSAEVLSPADDTDKSAILDGAALAGLTSRIDPRGDTGAAESGLGIRAEKTAAAAAAAAGNDVKSSSVNGVARSRVPTIIRRNPRRRPASASNLPEGRGPASSAPPHPARRDANSGTRSGLNGAKSNARSNGAADETGDDESHPSSKATSHAPREGDAAGHEGGGADEELRLPRRDSKVGIAMNSALKRYIGMLKQGLQNHGDEDVALASLSLSDAISILSGQRTPLSPEEIRELQAVLDRIERNPELLCKRSRPSMESVA